MFAVIILGYLMIFEYVLAYGVARKSSNDVNLLSKGYIVVILDNTECCNISPLASL